MTSQEIRTAHQFNSEMSDMSAHTPRHVTRKWIHNQTQSAFALLGEAAGHLGS
jgi:hypothetical protein